MEKFKQIQKIKEVYEKGGNIIQYIKKISNRSSNTIEDILISYDFQSGSYIRSFSDNQEYHINYGRALAKVINELEKIDSIIEVGVGEATTLNTVIRHLNDRPKEIFGFDISWSRLKFAKHFLSDFKLENINLFTANLFEIPLLDNTVDVVYTSHSIEPNGGKEEEALKELYRITRRYLVLLEPAYELANSEARERMIKHGYITKLYSTAVKLNYNIIEHRLFEYNSNPLNPTGLIIIQKEGEFEKPAKLVCPITHTDLFAYNESLLYSKESYLAYPVIDSIPCLLKENSILATHLMTSYNKYKKENGIRFGNEQK